MSIIIEKNNTKNFVILQKEVFNDSNLTWEAKGIWAYLMGLPDDRKINLRELEKQASDGIDSTRKALKELEDRGYLEKNIITEKKGLDRNLAPLKESPS